MAQSVRIPSFDERSLSSLVNFDHADSLSELLIDINGAKTTENKYLYSGNGAGITPSAPSNQALGDAQENCNAPTTATRLTTLQTRNQQLQRALALASVQHAKEIASMRRTILALEQQVAELKAERKEASS